MTDRSLHAIDESFDASLRRTLSQDVRRLVTGRMTNDEFDDIYYEIYASSQDRTVCEISSFCYCLYSSDLPLPYRRRGRYAVNEETRSAAARCVLFLRSGLKFEWPPFPDQPAMRVLVGLATSLGIPLGCALLFFWLFVALDGWDDTVGLFAIFGVIAIVASIALRSSWNRVALQDWNEYRKAGDHNVWPFIRRDDFEVAKRRCHLLGTSSVP